MKFLIFFLISINLFATINLSDYINKNECHKIINKGLYDICYDTVVKGPRVVAYTLYGDKVNSVNIKKRPRFYTEKNLRKEYRTTSNDYIYTGYDRGHINNDAANDYDKKILKKVYTMANIIPQSPMVNQKTWTKVEKYARDMAVKNGEVQVLNIIYYKDNIRLKKLPIEEAIKLSKKRSKKPWSKSKIKKYHKYEKDLYKKRIIIPTGFLKVIYTEKKQMCFFYKNDLNIDWRKDKLKSHVVECWKYLK